MDVLVLDLEVTLDHALHGLFCANHLVLRYNQFLRKLDIYKQNALYDRDDCLQYSPN